MGDTRSRLKDDTRYTLIWDDLRSRLIHETKAAFEDLKSAHPQREKRMTIFVVEFRAVQTQAPMQHAHIDPLYRRTSSPNGV